MTFLATMTLLWCGSNARAQAWSELAGCGWLSSSSSSSVLLVDTARPPPAGSSTAGGAAVAVIDTAVPEVTP